MILNIDHFSVLNQNKPVATLGTNAGTGASAQIDIKGDDTYGIITINTGDNPSGANVAAIAFSKSYGSDSLIIELRPYNRQAKGLICSAEAEDGTGFEINCSSELNDNDVYQFIYQVVEIINPQ